MIFKNKNLKMLKNKTQFLKYVKHPNYKNTVIIFYQFHNFNELKIKLY